MREANSASATHVSMNDQLKTVCEKLDQLTVEYIQEADAVSKLKETLGKEIAKVVIVRLHPCQ
jgi:hypothetical protein